MACLRLTQRCADILICVRQEVQDAGGDVGDELKEPVDKLVACVFFFFGSIYVPV
jgi:abelson tyrosine-protein kinase 1